MTAKITLTPNERFMVDIPETDRLPLAVELESNAYPQGHENLMFDGTGWSALGVWEWLNGHEEHVLEGYTCPLQAETQNPQFQPTLSQGNYLQAYAYADVSSITYNPAGHYCMYWPAFNMKQLPLIHGNTPFILTLSSPEDPQNYIQYIEVIGFSRMAQLIRGNLVDILLDQVIE
jgi:hypothetical protein